MPACEELEAALQRDFQFEDLAVYADALIERGDPRGELIACELGPIAELAAWRARRRELLARWLGDKLAARLGALVHHGFVHELRDGAESAAVLESPLGAYVRGYSTWGTERALDGLAELARQPRPWLTRLSIAAWEARELPRELCRAVLAAAPRLAAVHTSHAETARGFEDRVETIALEPTGAAAPTGGRAGELAYLRDVLTAAPMTSRELTEYYDGVFAEPSRVVAARAVAAGLVAADGPFLVMTPTAPAKRPGFLNHPWRPWLGDESFSMDDLPRQVGIERGAGALIFDPYPYVTTLIHALETLPLVRETQQALADHVLSLARVHAAPRELGAAAIRELAGALTCMIELHAFLERPWRGCAFLDGPQHPSEAIERVAAFLCHAPPAPAPARCRLYRVA